MTSSKTRLNIKTQEQKCQNEKLLEQSLPLLYIYIYIYIPAQTLLASEYENIMFRLFLLTDKLRS